MSNRLSRVIVLALRWLIIVLAFGVVAFASGSCGEEPVVNSGVEGEVRIAPVNPVEQPGVPNDAPYSATLRIKRASDGRVVAETTSGADGSFRVALPPGDYVLEPVNGDPLPIAVPQEFTVVPDRYTTVRVDYDSGIR